MVFFMFLKTLSEKLLHILVKWAWDLQFNEHIMKRKFLLSEYECLGRYAHVLPFQDASFKKRTMVCQKGDLSDSKYYLYLLAKYQGKVTISLIDF